MAKLNEEISKIEKGSALEALYQRLLVGMEEASLEQLPDFTGDEYLKPAEDGGEQMVVDEDKINREITDYSIITRKNSAFLFADAIAKSLTGSGGENGDTSGFLSLSGGSMAGNLKAHYGFSAGANGQKFLEVYQTTEDEVSQRHNIVRVNGELHLDQRGLYINGWNVMRHDNNVLYLDSNLISLNGDVTCSGTITLGELSISEDGINFRGKEFYHSGNSNIPEVDWTMKDGAVAGNLTVSGTSSFQSTLSALNGVKLGFGDKTILDISQAKSARLNGDFNIIDGGVQFNEDYIIHIKNKNVVSFSASNKIMNLGDDNTQHISLQTNLYDSGGEYRLISKYGDGSFPNSFTAGHGLGNTLLKTYKSTKEDSGVIISRKLRFDDETGPAIYGYNKNLRISGIFQYNIAQHEGVSQRGEEKHTTLSYKESSSLYTPLDRVSCSLFIETEADFYVFDKPLEGKTSIGIAESKTRLLKNQLFFSDAVYWLALNDGVKHYGNNYFVNDIGSETFSSGFAGSGWKIYKHQHSGNVVATFDELTIRKKMRIYELEVQKNTATNGSLWVSDSCSGDLVEEIST